MRNTVGKKFTRAIHYDFHTSPGIKNIFGNFDSEKFAEQLKGANVEYVNVTARCNMGYSYYNTKVGKKYEGLGDRDPLLEMIESCHKRNIGVTAYINVGLDHELAADNLGWNKVNHDGKVYVLDKKSNFFRSMCYNSPYRQHFLSEIREICEYDIDGLFIDCFTVHECYCPACTAGMLKRGINTGDGSAVSKYQCAVRNEFAAEIKEAMGDKKDRVKLFFNGLSWSSPLLTHAEIECLTTDPLWGYDFFDFTAAYTRTLYSDRVYMSGRFQKSWGDFGGIKPVASMQNDLYDAMMNSFAISFGDHLHPVDGFENEVASRIGTVMEEKLGYEKYVTGSDNIVEVGMLVPANKLTRQIPTFVKGAVRMFKELKLTYNIYDENGCFEKDGVKLLVLGEYFDMPEALSKRVIDFAQNGGRLLFTGSAVNLGKELGLLDYVEPVGRDTSDNAYYTSDGSDMRWAMYSPSLLMKRLGGEEVAKYVSKVSNFIWDGRQSYFYRPQGEATEYSAALINENSACICFDIFNAYIDNFLIEHRELVGKLIDSLLPQKLVYAPNMPKTATVALTKNSEHTVFHVKCTYPEHKMRQGIIEEHNYMKSVQVSLLGEYKVLALPELKEIDCCVKDGRTVFETSDILGYKAFLLEQK